MSIDLDKNKESVLQVYNDVLDDKTSTDWALFGYEGQTNILKVVASGDEGLDELAEDLNASKIMYGVIRLTDPKTSRTKIILLNWQGESAPNLRKGVCARHLPEVKKMLKGVHITVSARTEEDVDSALIMNAVSKSTATEYNFSVRSEIPDKNVPVKSTTTFTPSACSPSIPTPSYPNSSCQPPSLVLDTKPDRDRSLINNLGTNYMRTNPQKEIDANKRNRFWEEQEAEEKVRKELEIKKREEEAKLLEKERMDREVRELKQREQINKERNTKINAEKKAETMATERMHPKEDVKIWEKEVESQHSEEIERARRADQMRMERKKEAESLIGKSTHLARSIFEPQPHSHQNFSSTILADNRNRPPRVLKEFSSPQIDACSSSKNNIVPKRSIGSRWPPVGSPDEEERSLQQQLVKVPGRISDWKPQNEDLVIQSNVIMQPNSTSLLNTDNTSLIENQHKMTTPNSPSPDVSNRGVLSSSSPTSSILQSSTINVTHTSHNVESTSVPSLPRMPYLSDTQQEVESTFVSQPTSPFLNQTPNAVESTYVPQSQSHAQPSSFGSSNELPTSQAFYSPKSYNAQSPTSPKSQTSCPLVEHFNGNGSHSTVETFSNGIEHHDLAEVLLQSETQNYQEDIDSFAMTYEVDGVEYQILPEHGLCARALYDYQAADETEITFDPGDIITNIDQIDIGWWQGVNSLGIFGLFPANYVELINGTKTQ